MQQKFSGEFQKTALNKTATNFAKGLGCYS